MIRHVTKRSGRKERFSKEKLVASLQHALRKSRRRVDADALADHISRALGKKAVADVQDIRIATCRILRKRGMHAVCDAYSLAWLRTKPAGIRAVSKRSGRRERFYPEKIYKSVHKILRHTHVRDGAQAERIARDVLAVLRKQYHGRVVPTAAIKDAVAAALARRKLHKAARHYVLYRYL